MKTRLWLSMDSYPNDPTASQWRETIEAARAYGFKLTNRTCPYLGAVVAYRFRRGPDGRTHEDVITLRGD